MAKDAKKEKWDQVETRLTVSVAAVGWRIMIQDYRPATQTDGGVLLTEQSQDSTEFLMYIGRVVELGPLCYQHAKFGGCDPWCKPDDWIVFGRYAGQRIKFKGDDTVYRFVNDDEVLAVVSDPAQVIVYV